MTKIAGSGSISQRHGSPDPDPDPDPPKNVMDLQHWLQLKAVAGRSAAVDFSRPGEISTHQINITCCCSYLFFVSLLCLSGNKALL
jgi:hypothetical protein